MKKLLLLIFSLPCLPACKKDKGDTQEPMINVTSPSANQQFPGGQVVNVVAAITDDDQLHEVHLTVINKNTNEELIHYHNHVDVQSFNINEHFNASAGVTYNIKVEAEDHSGNHAEIQFEVKGI